MWASIPRRALLSNVGQICFRRSPQSRSLGRWTPLWPVLPVPGYQNSPNLLRRQFLSQRSQLSQ